MDNSKEGQKRNIRLSVVSHNQDELVKQLLNSVRSNCQTDRLLVTVTKNTLAESSITFDRFPFPVEVIQNSQPKGFGANHNQAFRTCKEEFFCVLNPDILIRSDPFDTLLATFSEPDIGVVAPVIIDSDDVVQDSARRFLTPQRVVSRVLFEKQQDYVFTTETIAVFPDWVAGMFMLYPASVFREIDGFDERFFMYCEDADICRRLLTKGYRTQLVPPVQVVHDAQRASHKAAHHLRYHVFSLLRFFLRYPFYTL